MMSGMANAATGGKISKDQETTIRNKMKASIKNVSINENNIKNIIENIVNTNITQNTTSTCQSNINANNTIDTQDGAIAAKNGGKITIRQSAAVDSLAKCIVDTANTTQISTAIISEGAAGAVNDTQNKVKIRIGGTDKGQCIIGYEIEEPSVFSKNFINVDEFIIKLINLRTQFTNEMQILGCDLSEVILEHLEDEVEIVNYPVPYILHF